MSVIIATPMSFEDLHRVSLVSTFKTVLPFDPVWCPSVTTSWCVCIPVAICQHGGSLKSAAAPMGPRSESSPATAGVGPSHGSLAAGVLAAPAATIACTTSAAAPTAYSAAATAAAPISRCANPHTPVPYPTDASQSPSAGPSTEGEGTSSTEGEGTSTTESLPSTCEIGNNPEQEPVCFPPWPPWPQPAP